MSASRPGWLRRPLWLALLALAFWGPAAAGAEDPLKIKVGIEPYWPPMEFLDSGGRIVGFTVDFFQAVAREAGCELEYVEVPWDDIFTGLKDGRWDMVVSSVTITPERRKEMNFSIPYYIVRQSLLAPASSSLASQRQLKGLKVGFQDDTTAALVVARSGTLAAPYPTIEEAVAALAKDEVAAVICEDVVAQSFLANPEYSGRIKMAAVIETPGAEELYAAAFRPDDLDLMIRINDGIKAVLDKGLDKEIRGRWFSGTAR